MSLRISTYWKWLSHIGLTVLKMTCRLEYVGDAGLNLLIAKEQFFSYPNLKPGILTPLRSKNVDSKNLAHVAIKHGLDRYLRHKKPKLGEQISYFQHDAIE